MAPDYRRLPAAPPVVPDARCSERNVFHDPGGRRPAFSSVVGASVGISAAARVAAHDTARPIRRRHLLTEYPYLCALNLSANSLKVMFLSPIFRSLRGLKI